MSTSVFDVFRVGVGPSSSHTVGPMRAAAAFVEELASRPGGLADVSGVRVDLLGSLGATGRGHGSDRAVLAGLSGMEPETVDPAALAGLVESVRASGALTLRTTDGRAEVRLPGFDVDSAIVFAPQVRLRAHPNALRLSAITGEGEYEATYYSIGGGEIRRAHRHLPHEADPGAVAVPYPFVRGADLLAACAKDGLSVAELMGRNEVARGPSRAEVNARLVELWHVMASCVDAGCHTEGVLPGGLGVRRRAPGMARQLKHRPPNSPMCELDWVSLWALAAGEQNAAGGRVVTAPTNGACGIVPAVLLYALRFSPGADDDTVVEFLLAAGAICTVFTATASISGAAVGCQGEVGVASSMAAAGLCQVLGGSPQQVLNAAEIGLEHHLGLTCDPVAGLVQVPCIERNAIGATTAITAARLALAGDGRQLVSLDQVIATMMATGADMSADYKETARAGLALSLTAC